MVATFRGRRRPLHLRRGATRRREPLRTFAASPVTGDEVQLLEGRYGPYVTDGQTNASLPKGQSPDEVTFEQAVDLLAVRAAKGPGKKATRKKAAKKTTKKTAKTKAAKRKSSTAKKTAKTKAAKKKPTESA